MHKELIGRRLKIVRYSITYLQMSFTNISFNVRQLNKLLNKNMGNTEEYLKLTNGDY